MFNVTERILNNMQDRRDYRLLAEMNGLRCAAKQMRTLRRLDIEAASFVAKAQRKVARKRTVRALPEVRHGR